MKKWEYMTLYLEFSPLGMDKKLESAGTSGWELVSIVDNLKSSGHYILCFFKREIEIKQVK